MDARYAKNRGSHRAKDENYLAQHSSQSNWYIHALPIANQLHFYQMQYLYSGKVFSAEELQAIAEILFRHPHVTAVMDEVYEKLVYDGKTHIRLASLPNMWDRTLTVSSCGKTFSCTGWKVGWVFGAAHLVKPVVLANQWIQYCVSSPTQASILTRVCAHALRYACDGSVGLNDIRVYCREPWQKS